MSRISPLYTPQAPRNKRKVKAIHWLCEDVSRLLDLISSNAMPLIFSLSLSFAKSQVGNAGSVAPWILQNNGRRQPLKAKPQLISRQRKPQNLVIGKKVSDGIISLKGADLTSSLYIGNVDMSFGIDDIRTFIEGQNVTVIELEDIARRHNRFKSFRLCLKRKDMDVIRDPNFWPEGIIVRKFFRKSNNDGAAMPSTSS